MIAGHSTNQVSSRCFNAPRAQAAEHGLKPTTLFVKLYHVFFRIASIVIVLIFVVVFIVFIVFILLFATTLAACRGWFLQCID